MKQKGRSRVIVAISIALLVSMHSSSASAFNQARAISLQQSFATSSLQIFVSGNQTYTNTGVAFTSPISNGVERVFFLNNGGSRAVSKFYITVTLPSSSNVSYFRRCNLGVLFSGSNTCASGSTTNIPITPGSEITFTLPLVQGTFYQFKIIQNKTGTITVNSRVNSTDIVATSTNS